MTILIILLKYSISSPNKKLSTTFGLTNPTIHLTPINQINNINHYPINQLTIKILIILFSITPLIIILLEFQVFGPINKISTQSSIESYAKLSINHQKS
jgi:hypothetical protein